MTNNAITKQNIKFATINQQQMNNDRKGNDNETMTNDSEKSTLTTTEDRNITLIDHHDDETTNSNEEQQQSQPPPSSNLPLEIIIGHILPFIDRQTWLNLSIMNKKIRSICMTSSNIVPPPWSSNLQFDFVQCNQDLSISISPDNRSIACTDSDGKIYFLDCIKGKRNMKRLYVPNGLGQIEYCPTNSNILAVGCKEPSNVITVSEEASPYQTTMLWDLSNDDYQINNRLPLPADKMNSTGVISWSSCGRYLAEIFLDLSVRIFDTKSQKWIHTLLPGAVDAQTSMNEADNSSMVRFGPSIIKNNNKQEEQQYVAAILDGRLYVWDLGYPNHPHKISDTMLDDTFDAPNVQCFAFSPCGRYIVYVNATENIYIHSLIQNDDLYLKCIGKMTHYNSTLKIVWVAFDPKDCSQLVTCGRDKSLRLWKMVVQEQQNEGEILTSGNNDDSSGTRFSSTEEVQSTSTARVTGSCIGSKSTNFPYAARFEFFSSSAMAVVVISGGYAFFWVHDTLLFNRELQILDNITFKESPYLELEINTDRRRTWRYWLFKLLCLPVE